MKILFLGYKEDETKLISFLRNKGHEVIHEDEKLTLKDFKKINPDYIISWGYRHLIKADVLNQYPRIINLHPSLLPWNRSAYSNFFSFWRNTPKGITIHYIDAGIDTGNILLQEDITNDKEFKNKKDLVDTYWYVREKMDNLFINNYEKLIKHKIKGHKPKGKGTINYVKDFEMLEKKFKKHKLWKGWNTKIKDLKQIKKDLTLNIAILGSTKGTDLEHIIKHKPKNVKIKLVISNKKSYILKRAKKHNIKNIYLNPKGLTKEEYDNKIMKLLEKEEIDLVLLIGYMKLIGKEFVKKWKNKIMNIHPSLLPAFAGGMDLNVHKAVLERGCKITGCSLIYIDEGADTGKIITQKCCPVDEKDTPETLKKKVQKLEGKALIEGIKTFKTKCGLN